MRWIEADPGTRYYKPAGTPMQKLLTVNIQLDEYEALRLADFEGLYHEGAAKKMNISRQTFGRILEEAHKKIADALIHNKIIKIEGGITEIRIKTDGIYP